MIRFVLPLVFVFSGCVAIQQTTDKAGRDAAKTVLPEALGLYFPQVPKQLFVPFTNCVVDNANASEVQSLAADALTGTDQNTADTIKAVLARPQTQTCLRAAAPAALTTF